MIIELSLRASPGVLTDFSGILPETLHTLSEREIAAKPVHVGNRAVPLGELFAIRLLDDGADGGMLRIVGDCSLLDDIGTGMTQGELHVIGDAGNRAGAGLRGGRLHIHGSAGNGLGRGMGGGAIHVEGDCGEHAGAGLPGARRGMTGGRITIGGNADTGLGARMRRGWIEVHSNCGPLAGEGMIAGTIRVHGHLGGHAGIGMVRGTIIAASMDEPGPGFTFACDFEPTFLRMLDRTGPKRVHCYRGDLLTGGRGELWRIEPAPPRRRPAKRK